MSGLPFCFHSILFIPKRMIHITMPALGKEIADGSKLARPDG